MRNRDLAVGALGRFLVVERYRQTYSSSSANRRPGSGPGRAGAHPGKPDSRSGSRVPARPQPG